MGYALAGLTGFATGVVITGLIFMHVAADVAKGATDRAFTQIRKSMGA